MSKLKTLNNAPNDSVFVAGWERSPWGQVRTEGPKRQPEGPARDRAPLEGLKLPPHCQHSRRLRKHLQWAEMLTRSHGRVRQTTILIMDTW